MKKFQVKIEFCFWEIEAENESEAKKIATRFVGKKTFITKAPAGQMKIYATKLPEIRNQK